MSDFCLSDDIWNEWQKIRLRQFIRSLKEEAIDCGCAGFVKRIEALAGEGLI